MYFWKCWRDSQTHFILRLIAVFAVCLVVTIIIAKAEGLIGVQKGTAGPVSGTWSAATIGFLGFCASLFILFTALTLGASGVGEEFKERTADFLLTQPRRRRYWIWAGWSVGVSELAVMAFLAVGTTFGTLTYLTGYVHTWRVLAATLPLIVGGVAVYGLAYLMTVVARDGRQGLSYAIGILFISLLLPYAVYYYWKVNFPSLLGFMIAGCKWVMSTTQAFPLGGLVLWTVIALVFPVAAQLVLERAEV
jgi:ABC-type transport system involved in multi-copper enzyme maturation permease subunit